MNTIDFFQVSQEVGTKVPEMSASYASTETSGDLVTTAQTALNALTGAALGKARDIPAFPSGCPNCGYCPCCGRSNYRPFHPYWMGTPSLTGLTGPNTVYCSNINA